MHKTHWWCYFHYYQRLYGSLTVVPSKALLPDLGFTHPKLVHFNSREGNRQRLAFTINKKIFGSNHLMNIPVGYSLHQEPTPGEGRGSYTHNL